VSRALNRFELFIKYYDSEHSLSLRRARQLRFAPFPNMSSINFLLFLAIHRAISTPPEVPDTAYASWCRQFSISACAGWSPEERAYRATVINANFATAKAATTESVRTGSPASAFKPLMSSPRRTWASE